MIDIKKICRLLNGNIWDEIFEIWKYKSMVHAFGDRYSCKFHNWNSYSCYVVWEWLFLVLVYLLSCSQISYCSYFPELDAVEEELEQPLCNPDPCGPNGVCVHDGMTAWCVCDVGYTGRYCETSMLANVSSTHYKKQLCFLE